MSQLVGWMFSHIIMLTLSGIMVAPGAACAVLLLRIAERRLPLERVRWMTTLRRAAAAGALTGLISLALFPYASVRHNTLFELLVLPPLFGILAGLVRSPARPASRTPGAAGCRMHARALALTAGYLVARLLAK